MQRLQDVLRVHDPDDVVDVFSEDGDPGEAALHHDVLHVAQRVAHLDGDDVRPGHHHLADDRVAELEDGMDELLLLFLDLLLVRGHLGQRLDLLLRDVGALG